MWAAVVSNRALILSAISVLLILFTLLVLLGAAPAQAQEDQYLDQYQTSDQYATPSLPAGSVVYFPVRLGNGATYSCSGSLPYVHDPASPSENCPLQQVGLSPGFVCDIPTTITFIHDTYTYDADAWLCHSDTASS